MNIFIKSNSFLPGTLHTTTKICSLRLKDKNTQVWCRPVHWGPVQADDGPIPLPHALRLLKSVEATHYPKPNSDGRLAERDHTFSGIKIQVRDNWFKKKVKWSFYIMARADGQLRSGMEFIPDLIV